MLEMFMKWRSVLHNCSNLFKHQRTVPLGFQSLSGVSVRMISSMMEDNVSNCCNAYNLQSSAFYCFPLCCFHVVERKEERRINLKEVCDNLLKVKSSEFSLSSFKKFM